MPDTFQNAGPEGGPTGTRVKPGCAAVTLIGLVGIILVAILQGDDWLGGGTSEGCDPVQGFALSAKCKAPTLSSSPDDEQSPDDAGTPDEEPDDESGDAGGPQTSADLPEDGIGTPGGSFAAPNEEDLPDGAVLYTGSSGDHIGCITCDGASRFLSIEKPGVVVGNTGMTSQATTWQEDGQILEFGANVSGPNKGRYGFNLFSGPVTYFNGCSMEIGSTSCLQARPGPLTKGTEVVIIIGEGGTMDGNKPASTGDFTVDWWFVFQPD